MSYLDELVNERTMRERRAQERDKREKATSKRIKILIVAAVLLVSLAASMSAYKWVVTDYEFQREVHSYMENAYWASTPELMIDQLEKCMDGMRSLGLSDDMYAKFLPWEQTPDWRMDYCYAHLDAVIERCYEVIDWRETQDLSSGQVTDVYNQKMTALHDFLRDGGWSDEIAKGAYYVNYHVMLAFWYPLFFVVCVILLAIYFVRTLIGAME